MTQPYDVEAIGPFDTFEEYGALYISVKVKHIFKSKTRG
jgi:hypothetical protein